MDWSKYSPYFSKKEFDCKHTGKNEMTEEFMDRLLELRKASNKPMIITSGYRDVTHPVEARKAKGGTHTLGKACDVALQGDDAWELVALARKYGFTGCGVNQKGSGRFIHLDIATSEDGFPRPVFYSY